MRASTSSVKPLPHLPAAIYQTPSTNSLDDESRILLWKLIHTWLRYDQVQAKWASVINDLLLRILQTQISEAPSLKDSKPAETTTTSPLCIQLFETGSPYQSKYLPSFSDGIQIQTLTDLPLPSHYAGTIRLYGALKSLQPKLIDIMIVSLYTLYSLRLEMNLMWDHHVQLSTKLSRQDHQKQISPTATSVSNDSTWRSGLLGWILGRNSNKMDVIKFLSTKKDDTIKRRQSMMGSRSLSRKPVDIKTMNDSIPTSNSPPSYHDSPDSHYYRNLRLGLQEAILSTSPTCSFATPPNITVLEKEEDNLNTMKTIISNGHQQQQQVEIDRQKRRSSTHLLRHKLTVLARRSSSSASFGPSPEQFKSFQTTIIMLPQSIMAYSLLRIPKSILNNTNKIGMDHLYLDTTSIEAFKHHQHLVISYSCHPIGCPDRPCLGPTLCAIQYFKFDDAFPYTDQSLGPTLKGWLDQCDQPCKHRNIQKTLMCGDYFKPIHGSSQSLNQQRPSEALDQQSGLSDSPLSTPALKKQQPQTNTTSNVPQHGCNQPFRDHVLCFSHGSSRISVYFTTTASTPGAVKSDEINKPSLDNGDATNGELRCWSVCTICDARTPSHRISKATHDYSFAKYLELCLYSARFMGPKNHPCQHATSNPSAIARCFVFDTTEIRFVKESINVYRLRGSPLQVVQPSDPETVSFLSTPRISSSTMERWKLKEEKAVNYLFRLIQQHLSYLHTQWLNGGPDDDISHWKIHLDMDHQHLLSALENACSCTDGSNLNDFRRFFTMKAAVILGNLENWQHQRWSTEQFVPPFLTWEGRPDYMNADINDTIHCFPGSAIMVREREPSSIIAFTLSSIEYTEELAYSYSSIDDLDPLTTLPLKTMASPTLSAKSGSDESKHSSLKDDSTQVIDSYYSSVERKYISPSTGAVTETASFRTMVMETVKNNVSEIEQHAPLLSQLWRSSTPPPSSAKIQLSRKTERDLDLFPEQSTKDIKESTFYQDPRRLNDDASSATSPMISPPTSPRFSSEDASKKISPHLKHRFIHGNKEFTCIVYYANEFELLRRSCGVDQLVIDSLGRCQNWEMSGGKSKSRFYKTHDNRLVVKEMMNAWNIAEKDAFLRFAPKYFNYLKKSDKEPTVLAKVFGFYSIQMRTLNDNKQIFNMDVLVMEQLFYGQSISKIFDFKGIPERQVDKERRNQQEMTLWDGDWKDAYRMSYVTFEQSREWIKAAIQRDTEFLASGNIMDYSLLVGIDDQKKELSIGIVDFIGAYTWYKKIESRSKSTIHRNREVTILPPDQYRHRFCKEVLDYFIPVPGKFDNISPTETNTSSWMI